MTSNAITARVLHRLKNRLMCPPEKSLSADADRCTKAALSARQNRLTEFLHFDSHNFRGTNDPAKARPLRTRGFVVLGGKDEFAHRLCFSVGGSLLSACGDSDSPSAPSTGSGSSGTA